LAGKDVQHHRTSKKELDEMRALVARDLADASIDGLSADRKYATAYNAALQAANMAIACAGYRVTAKTGHHKITFYCANLALGAGANTVLSVSVTFVNSSRRTSRALPRPRRNPVRFFVGFRTASEDSGMLLPTRFVASATRTSRATPRSGMRDSSGGTRSTV